MTRPKYGDAFRFNRVLSVYFYTSNTAKLLQARLIFVRRGYQLRHYSAQREPYDEDYSLGTPRLLTNALRQVSAQFRVRSVFFVEDTSVRIEALSDSEDYPGLRVKEWFGETSFDELDRAITLRGGDRRATVKSDIGLLIPTLSRPLFFHGETHGKVAESVPCFDASVQYPWLTPDTFNGWFVPDGTTKRLGEMEFEESLAFDFRARSLTALIDRLEELNAALNLGSNYYTVRAVAPQIPPGQLSLLDRERSEILLVIGAKCAGKTTLSDHLCGRGDALALEASMILRALADEQDASIESSDEALSFLTSKGMDIVAERIAEIISRSDSKLNIVTGLRTIEEILFLIRAFPHARIICVEADARTRFERHLRRARDKDVKSYRDFIAQDEFQAKFGILPVAHEIAHETLKNEGPIDQFQRKIDGLVDNASAAAGQTAKLGDSNSFSELRRCLVALDQIGRAATCDEIADQTRNLGFPVRKYNTNRALKGAPEFAVRVQKPGQLLRYRILARGRALLELFDVLAGRHPANSPPHQHRRKIEIC